MTRKHEQERDGKRLQLKSGDGQQVRCAGSGERIVDFGIDLFAPTQKQRRGQRRRRRIELLEKPATKAVSLRIDPDLKSPVGAAGFRPEALRVIDDKAQANSLGSRETAIVELTGIERRRERGDLAGCLDGLACSDRRPIARDDHDRST